jgi:hypothetical protein
MKKLLTAATFAAALLAAPLLAQAATISIGFQKSTGLLGILKKQGTLERRSRASKSAGSNSRPGRRCWKR